MRRYDRIKAVVSLDAIAHNFGEMKKKYRKGHKNHCCDQGGRIWPRSRSHCPSDHGYSYIWGFAVATAEEALQLRAFWGNKANIDSGNRI